MNSPDALSASELPQAAAMDPADSRPLDHISEFEVRGEVAALYDAHAPCLLRFATVVSRHPEVASDAVQESFLRYFIARRNGLTIEHPRTWLFLTLHSCLNEMMARLDAQSGVPVERLRDAGSNPASDVQLQELGNQLASSLTDRELKCLMLRAEGLRYREIADTLEIRIGTVAAFLNRAVRKAKAALGQGRS